MEQLNRRQVKLLSFLLDNPEFPTSKSLGEHVDVTSRTIRNDVDRIDNMMEHLQLDAEFIRKPSEGIKLRTSIKTAQIIKMALRPTSSFLDGMMKNVLFDLAARKRFIQLQEIIDNYFVSRSKALQILDGLEEWLKDYNLTVERRKHKGVRLIGDEWDLRRVMKDLSIENEKDKSSEYDFQLVFQEFHKMEQQLHFPLTDRARNNLLYHTLIFIQRLRLGNVIEDTKMQVGLSIYKHPEYKLATQFVQKLSDVFQITIPDQEADYFAFAFIRQ